MAAQKQPRWTKKKPKLTPAQVEKRWGKGAKLVKMGGGKGWTIANISRPAPGRRGRSGPGLPPGGQVQNPNVLPREWVGSEGVMGPWRGKEPPRLNPEQFEWVQNEHGRWFARPRTELTGLNTQQRADIQRGDAIARDTEGRLNSYYTQAAQDSQANNAATAGQLTALTGTLGASSDPNDPTAQALSENARAGQIPGVTAIQADLARQPDIMRESGATAASQFGAAWGQQRASTIAGYRNAQQEAAAAAREQNLQAMLEMYGINAQNVRTGIEVEGANQRAQIEADTAARDRAVKIRAEIAKLKTQLQIARERNETTRATNLANNIAKLEVEERKARAEARKQTPNQIQKWTDQAYKMARGIERKTTSTYVDGNGQVRTQPDVEIVKYNRDEIIRYLIAAGATRRQATQIANLAIPPLTPEQQTQISTVTRFW